MPVPKISSTGQLLGSRRTKASLTRKIAELRKKAAGSALTPSEVKIINKKILLLIEESKKDKKKESGGTGAHRMTGTGQRPAWTKVGRKKKN